MDKIISLGDPTLGEPEKAALNEVIDSAWLTMGERVKRFEREFSALHEMPDGIAVNSCTAGLHLAMIALGIGPGDEVLVPSVTFVATTNAVLYAGATPVFVDIESLECPHISLESAERLLSERTKAVIVMHYGGYLVDLPAWRDFCDRKGLHLIEDAAHSPAVGNVGRYGDLSVFSFFTNKNMTTAEGGMILGKDAAALEKTRYLRAHGMTTGTLDRYRGHAYSYDVTMLGYNYRMNELQAAMGLVQLERLPSWNARRLELVALYREGLERRCPEIGLLFSGDHPNAGHIMPTILPQRADRKKIMDGLRAAGIQSSIHYPPVHLFTHYRERFGEITLPRSEEFAQRELTLPLHPSLSEADVDRVVGALERILGE